MKNLVKKILVVLLVVVTAMVSFVSCKKDKTDKIEIIVSVNGQDTAERDLMNAWKVAYEKDHPEVLISVKTFNRDYTQTMMSYSQNSKNKPDIMWTTGEKHAAWSALGEFVNLRDIDPNIDVSDFYEEIINITHKNSSDTGIYFMPRDYNKCVLIINKVVFRAAGFSEDEINGLKDGWNYEKFMQTCERLKVAMQNNVNPTLGVRDSSVPVEAAMDFNASYCSFIKHFGGEFVEGDKVNFMSDRNLNAYGEIFSLIDKGYFAEAGDMGTAILTNLSAAMKIGVRPQVPSIPEIANYDIDFLPLPLDYVGVGCSGYAITDVASKRVSESSYNKGKKSNEYYAYEFLKYITSVEGQRIGGEMGSIIPVRKSMANDSSWTSYKSETLNHSAFISYPEKDFSLNIFQDFEAKDANTILNNLSSVMAQVVMAKNYVSGYTDGFAKLISSIQQFQNGVSNIKASY